MRSIALLLPCVVLLFSRTFAQGRESGAVLGQWLTAGGESKVEIYRSDSVTFAGRIVWLRDPLKDGRPVTDDQNPEDSLKQRPVLGLEILRGFTYRGDNLWAGGKIYDPKSGNDYSARMTLAGDSTLDLRGYVVIPLFGRTEQWVRR
jgi:uncharacterized protein (DUF2147 family)